MLTESSNSCQNHRHHHRHHRHHHKHHRRHGRHKSSMEKSASKRLKKRVNLETIGVKSENRSRDTSEETSGSRVECTTKHHPGRVLRNRRYRRPFEDHRHTKRLFTPEIKRFLKSWLVRRRDNPYPSRDEKKGLAVQTGLTYIQICNWFANWRRKLKNAGSEAQHRTWGNLIKSYNTKAQGNVEQFSLCSDDSIWEERDLSETEHEETEGVISTTAPLSYVINATAMDHSYSVLIHHQNTQISSDAAENISQNPNEQCINELVPNEQGIQSQMADVIKERLVVSRDQISSSSNSKYKNLIMEKYLTDLRVCQELSSESAVKKRETMLTQQLKKKQHLYNEDDSVAFEHRRMDDNIYANATYNSILDSEVVKNGCGTLTRKSKRQKKEENHPLELSKWLESAAKFKPGQNYVTWAAKNVTWQSNSCELKKSRRWNTTATDGSNYWSGGQHHREELDAAEALTRLSTIHH